MNRVLRLICVLLVALGCSSCSTIFPPILHPKSVVINPRSRIASIERKLMRHTPLGTTAEEALVFINGELYRPRPYHFNSQLYEEKWPDCCPEVLHEIRRNDNRDERFPADAVYCVSSQLASHGVFPVTVVSATWYFDKDKKLVAIVAYKYCGAI